MSSSRFTETVSHSRLLVLVGIILLATTIASCSSPVALPTLVSVAKSPSIESTPSRSIREGNHTSVAVASEVDENSSTADPSAVVQTAQADDRPVLTQTPTAVGGGIRPEDAQLFLEPDPGLIAPVDWRPPPVPVPHSIHPDDHYWLIRPIASDSRNYDLSWYHYGNRPMRVEALPYRVHHGLDFPNDTGTPVFAASSGIVVWSGNLPSSRDGVNYYGNTVIIKHDWLWLGQNVYTLYAHTLELFVEDGDFVEKGQLIAGVGASGEVSGPHLHLEVRVGSNDYQSTRNPALWLAPYEGWGTLAGRFMDQRGRLIHGAQVTIFPVEIDNDVEVSIKRLRTYEPSSVNSDDVWLENFVVSDLPAGEYRVVMSTSGATFRRTVFVRPGQTNYIVMQADFDWGPTETPVPTATVTPEITGTPSETSTPAG